MPCNIRTGILILSDTHSKAFSDIEQIPTCDVAIHCGDLTDGSLLHEFELTLSQLKLIRAPLKLVIAGNHDFTMDQPAFDRKIADAAQPLDPDLVAREYGVPGQARQLFNEAKAAGIVFLDEGMHSIVLNNGAQLTVYASPYTPSMRQWGFQYHPDQGHQFEIEKGVDLVITHGPPRGIMDYTHGRERAGCPDLFAAIARARPRLHCFGHIHEGWGAKLVTWKDDIENPTHFTAIDNDDSLVIENLSGLRRSKFESAEDSHFEATKREQTDSKKYFRTSHCDDDEYPLKYGEQTLFVNASIEGDGEIAQRPWIVDVDLPAASAIRH